MDERISNTHQVIISIFNRKKRNLSRQETGYQWAVACLRTDFLAHPCSLHMNHYRPRSEGDNALGSVRPSVRLSVRLSVCALTAEPFDLRP